MKTKILIASAIGLGFTLLSLDYLPTNAKSIAVSHEKKQVNLITTRSVSTILTIDSDLDGVTDDRDLCPKTPLGVIVNADGCPVVIGISAQNKTIIDSDNDGISDEYDLCPDTPVGTIVYPNGCPINW